MSGMPRRARTLTWKDVPPELRERPAGRYVGEAVDDEAPALTPEEEAGIEPALESYRQGRVVDSKRAARSSTQPLAVEGHLHRRGGRGHRPGNQLSQRTESNPPRSSMRTSRDAFNV